MRSIMLALTIGLSLAGCTRAPTEPRALAFCYQTLADVACYDRPDRGRESTFLGVYPVDDRSPTDRAFWLRQWRADADADHEDVNDLYFRPR